MPEMTYSEALNLALREEMRRDPAVFVMGEDVAVWGDRGGVFGVTRGLAEEFGPERVRDTPINEEAIVGVAVGAALTGMRPVVEIMYSDFLTLTMEPLVTRRPSSATCSAVRPECRWSCAPTWVRRAARPPSTRSRWRPG